LRLELGEHKGGRHLVCAPTVTSYAWITLRASPRMRALSWGYRGLGAITVAVTSYAWITLFDAIPLWTTRQASSTIFLATGKGEGFNTKPSADGKTLASG